MSGERRMRILSDSTEIIMERIYQNDKYIDRAGEQRDEESHL
jgi:hypothetical protein